ncbi:putative sortase [Bacillus sp. TS-2]|nr:putative sortase [Bacillus sp. TS-2]
MTFILKKSIWIILFLFIIGVLGAWFYGTETNETNGTTQPSYQNEDMKSVEIPETTPEIQELSLSEEFKISEDDFENLQQLYQDNQSIEPEFLQIPKLDISTNIIEVGQLEDGSMGVPDNDIDVGWYEPGPLPGEKGNAVLAGHVDSRTGPAIFYELDQLEVGDEIIIQDSNGEQLLFEVEKMESFPYDDAPLSEIFGSSDEKRLNLITCTGVFNREQGTHEDRLVVFTKLVEDSSSVETPEPPSQIEINGQLLTFHANRDEFVIGYRVYMIEENGEPEHVTSIANHERKSYFMEDPNHNYIVRTVNIIGEESE